jgi:hypothetical protein
VAEDTFERLLNALPRIAESVNKFESSIVQEHVFEALVSALGIAESPVPAASLSSVSAVPESGNGEVITEAGEVDETETTTSTRRKRRRSSPTGVSA